MGPTLYVIFFSATRERGNIGFWCYPNTLGPKTLLVELVVYLIENNIGYIHYDW